MRNIVKITAFLLLFGMFLGVLSGCSTEQPEAPEATEDQAQSEQNGEEPSENADSIVIDGGYAVSYLKGADNVIVLTAEQLVKDVAAVIGQTPSLSVEMSGELRSEAEKEIFVGKSEREKYAFAYDGLEYGEWRIAAVENSVVLAAINATAALDAVAYFKEQFFKDGKIVIPKDFDYKKEADFTVESVKLGGIDLAEYSVVYKGSNAKAVRAASDLVYSIGVASGVELPMVKATANTNISNAIVVGETVFHSPVTNKYGDSKVYVEGSTVYVDGTDIVGLESGVSYLASVLLAQKNVSVELASLSYESSLQDRSEYENDASKFNVCYAGRISTPEEKLPLSYKVSQLYNPKGEVLVIAHRCEHTYYPPNSLEALISAWRIGAFGTEVDIHKTKDGYYVGSHDDTVTGANNNLNVAAARVANPNLPTSDKISDWTLAELRELRLLDDYGDVTPFVIMTLQEAMRACDGRIFLHIDKLTKTGDPNYVEDILPIMEELGIYECVYVVNGIADAQAYKTIIENAKQDGHTLHVMVRLSGLASLEQYLTMANQPNSNLAPAAVITGSSGGDFVGVDQRTNELVRDKYSDMGRIATWVLREADYEYYWRLARSYNYSVFLTDHPFELLQTIK